MADFEHIRDPRERLLARLNLAMRKGTAASALVEDAIDHSVGNLADFERGVLAQHLLEAIEDELGDDVPWSASGEGGAE